MKRSDEQVAEMKKKESEKAFHFRMFYVHEIVVGGHS